MEKTKKIDYFEYIKLVDNIFPSKSKLNYLETSPEELISRFEQKLEESGLTISAEQKEKIRGLIETNQRFLYKRKTNSIGENEDASFDQNNYYVQSTVSIMRNLAMGVLLSPMFPKYTCSEMVDQYDTYFFGNTELIESIVNKENILNYVRDTLFLTCANDEIIKESIFSVDSVVRDIFYHFGIKTDNSYNDTAAFIKVTEKVSNLIKEANERDNIAINSYPDQDGLYYINKAIDKPRFEMITKEIAELLCGIAIPALAKTKLVEEIDEEIAKNEMDEKRKNELTEEPTKEETAEEAMRKVVKKYQRLREISEENIQLSQEFVKICNDIGEFKSALEKLETRKKEIEEKLKKNASEIEHNISM